MWASNGEKGVQIKQDFNIYVLFAIQNTETECDWATLSQLELLIIIIISWA